MKSLFALSPLWVLLAATAWAADPPAPGAAPPAPAEAASLEDQLPQNPDDTAKLNEYMMENSRRVFSLIETDPAAAEKAIAAMKQRLESLQPTTDEAKQLLARAKSAIGFYEQRLALARTTLEELETRLKQNADDAQTIGTYASKVLQVLGPLASAEPEKAETQLNAAKQFLADLKAKTENEETKKALDSADSRLSRLTQSIERAKRLAALVGKDSVPLAVSAWVNGEPLTDGDLKGQVVLLDFWSVWCGPCIATFPHLRQWHEKYADKGLVIIGLTRYYNYTWDDAAGRATRATEPVPPEKENEMLVKFAEHHQLRHRFAIQQEQILSDYYAVTGIPHVVLIGRDGKIHLVRVGSGEKNAHDIEEQIEKLIGSPPAE